MTPGSYHTLTAYEKVLGVLKEVTPNGTGSMALCPAHDDKSPSLSVAAGEDGRVLLHCHAGCAVEAIVGKLGLQMSDLFEQRHTSARTNAPGITVAELANAKSLPETFLRECGLKEVKDYIGIPYSLRDGSPAKRNRIRKAIRAKDGSLWAGPRGGEIVPYGLWRLNDVNKAGFMILVEGESDVWTLWYHGFPALGIPGANMAKTIRPEYVATVDTLYVIQEADEGGSAFVRCVHRRLKEIGWPGKAKAVSLPEGVKDPNELHRVRPDSFRAAFERALDMATPLLPEEDRKQQASNVPEKDLSDAGAGLPQIVAKDRQLRDITDDSYLAVQAWNDPPRIFVRTGDLNRVIYDEKRRPIIQPLSADALRGIMSRSADYVELSSKGEVTENFFPPPEVVRDLLTLGSWPGFPPLEAIVEVPTFRRDGTILTHPGYDTTTSLIYAPPPCFTLPPIPNSPTKEDVATAVRVIDDVIAEFPYVDEASRANTFALLLTPIMRQAISGKVPLALLDAPQAGTGKSLLAEVIALTTTGRAAAVMGAPRDDEEWRKQITSLLLEGATMIIIDNVDQPLASGSLSRALTASQWKDRLLGVSKEVTLQQRATWMATGNNLRVAGDLARRTYWIRLNAKTSRPWKRSGFKHPNLISWVAEHRGEVLGALLTLARAWYAAGQPSCDVRVIGNFEEWCTAIGGILALGGITGFLGNLEEMYEAADVESPQWEAFLSRWFDRFGEHPITVATVVRAIQDNSGELRDALPELLAEAQEHAGSFTRKLGKALSQRVEKRYGDQELYLERGKDDSHNKVARWRVRCGKPDAGFGNSDASSISPSSPVSYVEKAGLAGFEPTPLRNEVSQNRSVGQDINIIGQSINSCRAVLNPANPANGTQASVVQRFARTIPPGSNPADSVEGHLNSCPLCGSTAFWRDRAGAVLCESCHAPDSAEVIAARWIN